MKSSELPYPLALLRIVVPLVIIVSPELYDASALAGSPAAFVPEGLGSIARLSIGPNVARAIQALALSSAATAALGWMSRTSLVVLTCSAGFLFSFSQRGGAVLHDMHLFWLSALLAASPCGDVWSLDAWGRPRPGASAQYGVPIAFARLLLGLVYFFPGLHKLTTSGTAWMTADNVIHHMQAKWLENGSLPFVRLDHAPLLCSIGAVGVVLFELSFVFLGLGTPRTRGIAIAGGLLFHAATQLFFFIRFPSLWALYVVLLDGKWLARLTCAPIAPSEKDGPFSSAIAVGALLTVAVLVQGVRGQTQAWPFACYPTFAHVQTATIPEIALVVNDTDGARVTLTGREARVRSQSEWAHVFRISGAYDGQPQVEAVRTHARAVLRAAELDRGKITRVRAFRADVLVAPESWTTTPQPVIFLADVEPPF